MSKITVRIDSSRPIFIEAEADSFGQIFAGLNDEEQVNVLRSMVEHMKPHKMQWDYIAIALEKDENREVRLDLSAIFPSTEELLQQLAAQAAEIARLREALEPSAGTKAAYCGEFSFTIEDRDEDGEECFRHVSVPWTTVKEIMAAIRARAALAGGDDAA